AGFRLQTLEVFNWGTFHKEVWRLDLKSRNGLLTGDIGSGKSTLVDAVTTLLVPAHRVAYNKAAGADIRERSLRSYVLGYYKSERSEIGHTAKSVALRDHNSFSVILGVFKNKGFVQEVTLAQVFWIKESQGQPERFYLVADSALSITDHFRNFGSDIGQLKKRLKKMSNIEVFETFPKYGAAFRRRFGIENEQALALFHQTVSMKSVGNLTDFVREHMLESFEVTPRIETLIHHFDDLNRAHDAVLRAKNQIERLTPLVEDCKKQATLVDETKQLRDCREALTPFFALHKMALFKKRMTILKDEQERLDRKIQTLDIKRREQMGSRDELKQAISENGGDRLARIRSDIERLGREKEKRRNQADRYANLALNLPLKTVTTPEDFHDNAQKIRDQQQVLKREDAGLQNTRTDIEVDLRGQKSVHQELAQELLSLSKRKSNIHAQQIRIRNDLCAHLGLDEKNLPFAGELIQVHEAERLWEGAAERLLHNFGLSLLVSESDYKNVAAWVDATHLKGRLVYYLVRLDSKEGVLHLHPTSLVKKLSIKPDSSYYSWMEKELATRFDYACCTDIRQFHREPMAVTEKGQIKSHGKRHEKDDRKDIKDRSNYILGWTNEAKIRILKQRGRDLEKQMQALATTLSNLDTRKKTLQENLNDLIRLDEFRDFCDLDWKSVTLDIARLIADKERLEAASDVLKILTLQLEILEKEIDVTEQGAKQARDIRSKNEEKQQQTLLGIKSCEADLTSVREMEADLRKSLFKQLESMRRKELEKHILTIE
ncbi:MAG: ATP-dependent exonuclease SbcCD, C subunit-like protein, partial [Proteobacteria bacterium]|nr:ATP-dependent exonuclease SbcCD, C subunit-like protein [Pseudomonadota bacterium]